MEILIPAERIQQRVAELARQIAADYQRQRPTIVGVLTGCLMFLADLVRHLDLPLRIGLIQASSYRGTATTPGELHVQPDLLPDVRGRHVLLLDDILDTGQTLSYLVGHLQGLGPARCRSAVLLRKLGRQQVPLRAGLLRLRHPRRLRGRLRPGLQRRVPPPALSRRCFRRST